MKKITPLVLFAIFTVITPMIILSANNCAANLAIVSASTARTIQFSGYTWYVEERAQQLTYPGPNYFSSSTQNVWVDTNGWLHLKITYSNGKWYCPEVTTAETLGYGTYAFYLANRIDTIDKNVVLGLFAYKDNSHEVDIEFSKWGNTNSNNSWYTVQPPPYVQGKTWSFNMTLNGDYTTHYFTWKQNSVYFESVGGHYPIGSEPKSNIIQSFTSNSSVSATGVKAHMNLWIFHSSAPSNGQPVEVIVKSFKYIP